MGMSGPMSMNRGGPVDGADPLEKVPEEGMTIILNERVYDSDVREEYDDALGNGERRMVESADPEAPCLRQLFVGVSEDTSEDPTL